MYGICSVYPLLVMTFFICGRVEPTWLTPHVAQWNNNIHIFSLGNIPSKYQYWSVFVALAWLLLL